MDRLGKLAVCFLLMALAFSFLATVMVAQGGSSVGGSIDSAVTWTKAKSPYALTSDVTVSVGATLTVEAGVTVYLQGHKISTGWGYDEKADVPLHSVLDAKGTTSDPICFNGGKISLQHTLTSAVEYSVLSETSIEVTIGTPTIRYCTITGACSGIGIYCDCSESPLIIGNTISGWDIGIKTGANVMGGALHGYPKIEGNMITGNKVGVSMLLYDVGVGAWDYPQIINNTITGNSEVGIQLEVGGPRWTGGAISDINITNNNIYDNPINAQAKPTATIIASGNWWGITDSAAIKQTLSGEVVYEPFLLAPYNDPSSQSSRPSSPSLQPTAPTQTETDASEPEAWEVNQVETWILYALIVIIALLLVIVALFLKKRR